MACAIALIGMVCGGAAGATAADCTPSAPASAYPPGVCLASTSTNTIVFGGKLGVSGGGFEPQTAVSVDLHSAVVALGRLTSDKSGLAQGAFTIPMSVPVGAHELQMSGRNPDGSARLLTASVVIQQQSLSGGSSSSAGTVLLWTGVGVGVLLIAGVALLLVRRRVG
jgi:hypothetical protein